MGMELLKSTHHPGHCNPLPTPPKPNLSLEPNHNINKKIKICGKTTFLFFLLRPAKHNNNNNNYSFYTHFGASMCLQNTVLED